MRVVVLVSGGMDSVTALYDARASHQVDAALSFRYGSKHNDREIPCARWHCERLGVVHRVISLEFIGELFRSALLRSGGEIPDGDYDEARMRQTVVPFRNGILLAAAAGYAESAGAEGLVIAAHAGDHALYPDCREPFLEAMGTAIRLGTYAGITLLRPFVAFTKARIAARARELGVDLGRTWSCYRGGEVHCGTCGTCVERRDAFALAGVPDPTEYQDRTPRPAAEGGPG